MNNERCLTLVLLGLELSEKNPLCEVFVPLLSLSRSFRAEQFSETLLPNVIGRQIGSGHRSYCS